jgi:hypothetical protein
MTRRPFGAAALVALAAAQVLHADEKPFAKAAGEYLSSVSEMCRLKLRPNGSYLLIRGDGRPRTGQAIAVGPSFAIQLPDHGIRIAESFSIPAPTRRPGTSTWPPSLDDPTAPLVVSRSGGLGFVVLNPLRWGSRLYLVRSLRGFCGAIAAGKEPRSVPFGDEFFRSGDHKKKAGKEPPPECSDPPRIP